MVLMTTLHSAWREAGCDSLQSLLCSAEGIGRCTHIVGGMMSVQLRCRHLFNTGNSYKSASNLTEVVVASSIATFEHIHYGADKSVRVFHQLAIASKIKCLKKKTESCLDKNLIAVETEREAEFTLVKQLNDLDDMLAGITNSHNSRRALVAEVGNDNWSVDQRPDVVICQRLIVVSLLCVKKLP
jgi:hypothetical protein